VSHQRVLEWGVAMASRSGQQRSGDRHLVTSAPDGSVLLAVVDGLGHGDEAAEAADRAAALLGDHPHESVIALARRCHAGLQGTRGVVMTLARVSPQDETLTWLGVGNVAGLLVRGTTANHAAQESVLLRGGVVGYQLPPLSATVHALDRGDAIVLATDGIRPDFSDNLLLKDAPQRAADQLLARFRREADDALVLVARYQGPILDA
jgi:negative regulator of sigma-B (phosphoserine phosphatase)